MKQTRMKSMLSPLLLLAALCLPACNNDDEGLLPEGKYPVTFTARIGELTIVRSTADLNLWTGDEKVAIQITDKVKKYAAASDGTLSVAEGDPFFWQKLPETKEVSAWYPYNDSKPTTFAVQTDQSESGYAASDFLYAKPQDITYIKDGSSPLTFKHLPAKVIIHLKYGKEFTADEIETATVSIIGQATTSETIEDNGSVPQATSGAESITPNKRTPIPTDFFQSVQALLVPQQMQNKDFIKVTVKGNDFYYIPTGENDANLESGKQYTYKITVKKTGLEVSVDTPVSWKEGAATSGAVAPATSFNVTCPGNGNGVEDFNISGVNPNPSGDKYTVGLNKDITISYTTDLKRSRYNLVQGIAKVSTSTDPSNETITLAVSDIRGDLVFSFDEYAEVGDYYYADGTWSPDYLSGSGSPACIGIVFKVGAGTGDDASYYGDKLSKGIRGYVAALKDANDGELLAWSTENTATGVSTSKVNFDGYSNTQIIKRISGYKTKYPAFQSCIDNNGTAAPDASSGWYLPSCAQIQTFDVVCGSTPLVSRNLNTAGGELLKNDNTFGSTKKGDYWTSNEESGNRTNVWHYSTYYPSFYIDHKKTDTNTDLVRAILTF